MEKDKELTEAEKYDITCQEEQNYSDAEWRRINFNSKLKDET